LIEVSKMDTNNTIEEASRAINENDLISARKILSQIIQSEPNNDMAWTLFARVAEKQEQSIYCLERAIQINPKNLLARTMMDEIRNPPNEPYNKVEDDLPESWGRFHIPEKPQTIQSTTDERPSSFSVSTVIWGIVILCIIVYAFQSCAGGTSGCDEAAAYVAAKGVVKRDLKAPSSAKFPFSTGDHVTKTGGGYNISSWVEAENSFGAKLRVPWSATVVIDSNGNCKVKSYGIYDY
jgi:hypothetical protein